MYCTSFCSKIIRSLTIVDDFRHAKNLSWMRRPDYISTEQTRFQPTTIEKVESKVGFAVRKKMDQQSLFMDRESQIAAIEKTFEASPRLMLFLIEQSLNCMTLHTINHQQYSPHQFNISISISI